MSVEINQALREEIAKALNRSAQDLDFSRVESEEAEVWRVSIRQGDDTAIFAWYKRHRQTNKAIREREAIEQWGRSVGAPNLIAQVGANSLLLEHCEGITLHEGQEGKANIAMALGRVVADLHLYDFEDHDKLPLYQAVQVRAIKSFSSLSDVYHRLQRSLPAEADQFYDDVERLQCQVETGELWIVEGEQRVPCHRDLRAEHIIYDEADRREFPVRLIDWGQSRGDHWTSDWVKLWLDPLFYDDFELAWKSYLNHRLKRSSSLCSESAVRALQAQSTLHVLNTLSWSLRPRNRALEDLVWSRGLEELRVLNKRRATL